MNFRSNTVIKEHYSFFVGSTDGFAVETEHGLYNRDTRFLCKYHWALSGKTQTLLSHSRRPDQLTLHHAELDHHRQLVAYRRKLVIGESGLTEQMVIENPLEKERTVVLELSLDADFADLFEVRGWQPSAKKVVKTVGERCVSFAYTPPDGVSMSLKINFSRDFVVRENRLLFKFDVPSQGERILNTSFEINNPLETGAKHPISYDAWRAEFADRLKDPVRQRVRSRAIDDLRALLLFDENGTLPAAGIPWYVAPFGRDALLTAYMLLPEAPLVAKGALHYFARHQATTLDAFREAQPGKIMHELRFGELARTGKVPHSPYYGTVDATPLFIVLLAQVYELEGDLSLIKELRPHWEAALDWMTNYGDADGDEFLEYVGLEGARTLRVQSWKDSEDSISYEDGTLAWGAIAVCEVQGYAYAAYLGAARFYYDLGNFAAAQKWREKASSLKERFHKAFWLSDLGTYAVALDQQKRPLRVHSSGVGHLLWSGIVPDETAGKLAETLMSRENWSGWGIRTLGKSAKRYNPVSYHNGSVWPHDTALVAGGLARYGFTQKAKLLAEALFDVAASQPDLRPPELVGGYDRSDDPPVPYPTACRPQAWSSASLIYLSRFLP